MKIKNCGVNINKFIPVKIDVPKNKNFCPVLDIYVWEHRTPVEKKLFGVSTISLFDFVKLYHKEELEEIEKEAQVSYFIF